MKSLEQLAKKMFTEFSMRKHGMVLDWKYLSKERRAVWMKEITETFNMCLDDLNKELDLTHINSTGAASYEKGFLAGQKFENTRLKQRVEYLKEWFQDQLYDYENNDANN